MSGGHRHTPPGQHEHEFEAARGLPEPLPAGESILWQGGPDWRPLAIRAFHVRKVALYFLALLALRVFMEVQGGAGMGQAVRGSLWLLPLFAVALGLLGGIAWLSARTTVYTITDRRVVMRIGIALTVTFNLPLRSIVSAGLHAEAGGHGDIALRLGDQDRIAYLHLWPHARAWHLRHAQPTLRCVPEAARVAAVLSRAWSLATGEAATPMPRPAAAARSEVGPIGAARPAV